MGKILEFNIGCRKCEYLICIGKGMYCCDKRVHLDDSLIIPIKDGRYTDEWGFCQGEFYERKVAIKKRMEVSRHE